MKNYGCGAIPNKCIIIIKSHLTFHCTLPLLLCLRRQLSIYLGVTMCVYTHVAHLSTVPYDLVFNNFDDFEMKHSSFHKMPQCGIL